MTPNAAMMASARPGWVRRIVRAFGALFCAALPGLVPPALAGDRAGIDFFGYSPDLAYFAFEEFGVQDGSGFAYANIYLLDLAADRWVTGSPIRLRVDDEAVSLSEVRARAAAEARPLLARYGIAEPVDILALNGDGDAGADPNGLSVGRPGYGLAAPDRPFQLTLESFVAPGDPSCADYTDAPLRGFALAYERDGARSELHRDARVPASRGCALDYRLYGVVAPFDSFAAFTTDPATGLVAIVSVYALGFEGPDRRFLAVPLGR